MVYINININNHLSMSTNVVVNAAGKVICAVIYCNIGTRKEKMTTIEMMIKMALNNKPILMSVCLKKLRFWMSK